MGKKNKKVVNLNENQNVDVKVTDETNVTENENTEESKENQKMGIEVIKKDNIVQKIGKGIVKAGDKLDNLPKPVKIGAKIVTGVALVGAAGAAAVAVIKNGKKDDDVVEIDFNEVDDEYDDDYEDYDEVADEESETDDETDDDQGEAIE